MKRVLVVEDDPPIRSLLTDLLEGEGYAVSEAATGADAVAEVGRERPELIVLDLMLPDMDGRKIAEKCHRAAAGKPIPIMLISAAAPALWETAAQLRQFGVRGFMSKPFDLDIFLRALEGLTEPAFAI